MLPSVSGIESRTREYNRQLDRQSANCNRPNGSRCRTVHYRSDPGSGFLIHPATDTNNVHSRACIAECPDHPSVEFPDPVCLADHLKRGSHNECPERWLCLRRCNQWSDFAPCPWRCCTSSGVSCQARRCFVGQPLDWPHADRAVKT